MAEASLHPLWGVVVRVDEAWDEELAMGEFGERNILDVLLSEDIGDIRWGNVGLNSEDSAGRGDCDEGVGDDLELSGREGVDECCVDCLGGFRHDES